MAKKRMTTTQITDSDDFISMPSPAQALYLHLNNGADDDGFNNQIQMAIYKAHASLDDLKILLAKRFILQFECGVIVIKHWRMANSLRKDRYTPTAFQEELKMLGIKENGAYTLNGNQMATKWQPLVATDKNSIDKLSIDKNIEKPHKHKYGEYMNVLLSDEELEKLKAEIPNYLEYIEKVSEYCASTGKSYKNYLATIRNWHRKDNEKVLIKDVLPTYDKTQNEIINDDEAEQILKEIKNVSK